MKRNPTPSYTPHRASGRARAMWTDRLGVRHERLLPGALDSKESLAAHARLCLEVAVTPSASTRDPDAITVVEVLGKYYEHAVSYYSDSDGKPTKELACMKSAIKPVRELYGDVPAIEFGPKKLAAVRQRMIGLGWCRNLINRRVNLIRRVFKWGVAEELIPASVLEALRTLGPLLDGRTEARESAPVRPVSPEVVDAS